jgi:hypothetical protein
MRLDGAPPQAGVIRQPPARGLERRTNSHLGMTVVRSPFVMLARPLDRWSARSGRTLALCVMTMSSPGTPISMRR